MDNWNQTILVVAHLDDEALWFSSIVEKVDAIVVCFLGNRAFPAWEPGRLKSLEAYPLKNISCLGIEETEAFDSADWLKPIRTPYGIETPFKPSANQGYRDAYTRVKEKLAEILKGYSHVVTHNPWGEYGHEEHILVHRVIDSLKTSCGYQVWFNNYFSNRSAYLMQQLYPRLNGEYLEFDCNGAFGEEVKALLTRHDCWTWYDDWEWYQKEALLSGTTGGEDTKPRWSPYPPLNPIYIHLRFKEVALRRSLVRRVGSKVKGLLRQSIR